MIKNVNIKPRYVQGSPDKRNRKRTIDPKKWIVDLGIRY